MPVFDLFLWHKLKVRFVVRQIIDIKGGNRLLNVHNPGVMAWHNGDWNDYIFGDLIFITCRQKQHIWMSKWILNTMYLVHVRLLSTDKSDQVQNLIQYIYPGLWKSIFTSTIQQLEEKKLLNINQIDSSHNWIRILGN
jgi:hypothetical protein